MFINIGSGPLALFRVRVMMYNVTFNNISVISWCNWSIRRTCEMCLKIILNFI